MNLVLLSGSHTRCPPSRVEHRAAGIEFPTRRRWSRWMVGLVGLWSAMLGLAAVAQAQSSPASLPNLSLANPGLVYRMAVQDDGRLLISGLFTPPPNTSAAVRLEPNGSVDPNWAPGSGGVSIAAEFVPTQSGIFITGFAVNGIERPSGLSKLDRQTGEWDQSWNPELRAFGFVPLVVADGSHLLVGGQFDVLAAGEVIRRSALVRVSMAGSGAIDPNWQPQIDGQVHVLAIVGSNLFIAGSFEHVDGLPRRGLAKLSLATGQVDAVWKAGANLEAGSVRRIAVMGTNLFVVGNLAEPNGASRLTVVRISTEDLGDVAAEWNPNLPGSEVSNVPNTTAFTAVYCIAATNAAVYLGGVYRGPSDEDVRPFLIKVAANGTGETDHAWTGTANVSGNVRGQVNALVPHETGLYVGGQFSRAGTSSRSGTAPLSLARLNYSTGERDRTFHGQATEPGIIRNMARQADGRLLIAGNFEAAGGLARRGLARINLDGQVDPQWAPEVNGTIDEMDVGHDGLFLRGKFTQVNGAPRNGLAKIALQRSDAVDAWDPVGRLWTNTTIRFFSSMAAIGSNWFGLLSVYPEVGEPFRGVVKLNGLTAELDSAWRLTPGTNTFFGDMLSDGAHLFISGQADLDQDNQYEPWLAKAAADGTGAFDPDWRPTLAPDRFSLPVLPLVAVHGNQLFVQATGGSLARIGTGGIGEVDPDWSVSFARDGLPLNETLGFVTAADVDDRSLLVAGNFTAANGQDVGPLALISTLDTGSVHPGFFRLAGPFPFVTAILATGGDDWYVGGNFREIGGERRDGLALLATVGEPALIQDTETNLFIVRGARDGPEVTHFFVVFVAGAPLFRSDGGLVQAGDFLTVAQGEAGLRCGLGGSLEVASAVGPTPTGVGLATAKLTISTNPTPTVRFTAPTYPVREGEGFVTLTVRKYGGGFASTDYQTDDQTALGDQRSGPVGADYRSRSGTLTFLPGDRFKTINIPIADDLITEGDEEFMVRIGKSANSVVNAAAPTTARVVIVDNDIVGDSDSLLEQRAPRVPPASTGQLTVTLAPAGVSGRWRLAGSLEWRASGAVQTGLDTGEYLIEFSPVDGYREPFSRTVSVRAGQMNLATAEYALALSVVRSGKLTMTIEPAAVAEAAAEPARGGWRRQGTALWQRSGDVEHGVSEGIHAIEFKPVSGYLPPRLQAVWVSADDGIHGATALYSIEIDRTVDLVPVPFGTAGTNSPYQFNGQLRTSVGFASGFVVRPKVVLTAAHVLFDDATLSYVAEVDWAFQRYRDELEPVRQTPRGWYVFDGYAARRQIDQRPGVSSPESQHLDVAALYFLEPAGRGGYGGFVSSDAQANDYLLNAEDKFLSGYPVEGVAAADSGKLHASRPANLAFRYLYGSVYATDDVQGLPGNSGGPLYVRTGVDTFYPAAVYLGGTGQSLFRAINSEVADLVNRADQSANGGGNSTGGGVTLIGPGVTVSSFENSRLTVQLRPSALGARAGWRVVSTQAFDFVTNLTATAAVAVGITYSFEFKAVEGFVTPSPKTIRIANAEEALLVEYATLERPALHYDFAQGLTMSGDAGATYRVEWSSNLALPVFWQPLTNVTITGRDSVVLPVTARGADSPRFFRAVLLP